MSSALAIVLLLNGVQVGLPHPALLVEGVACVPLRAVLERRGAVVILPPGGHMVQVQTRHGLTAIPVSPIVPSPPASAAFVLGGVSYMPARALADRLGGACTWHPAERSLRLELPWLGAASSPTAAERAASPLAWHDRLLTVAGRHGGRPTALLSPTGGLQPATGAGFMVAGGENLSWSTQDHSKGLLGAGSLSGLGLPLRMTGVYAAQPPSGGALRAEHTEPLGSQPSVHLRLVPRVLHPGDRAILTVTLRNDARQTISLDGWEGVSVGFEGPAGQRQTVRLSETVGGVGAVRRLEPGAELSWMALWQAPVATGREQVGLWRLRLRRPADVQAAEADFLILQPPSLSSAEAMRAW